MSAEVTNQKHIIQAPVPLSQSTLWFWQQQYYEQKFLNTRQSANLDTAKQYAELAYAMLNDWQIQAASNKQPMLVVELGASNGHFSSHFLDQMQSFCDQPLEKLPFRYIQTDRVKGNLDFWRLRDQFASWQRRGVVECTYSDEATPQAFINSLTSGQLIDLSDQRAPLLIIANDIFESLPSDIFYVKNNQGYLGQLGLYASDSNQGHEYSLKDLYRSVHMRWLYTANTSDFLRNNVVLNEILDDYQRYIEGYILLPTFLLKNLEMLQQRCRAPVFILTTDRGPVTMSDAVMNHDPYIATQGKVTIPVNFHCLKRYCQQYNGFALTERTVQKSQACQLLGLNSGIEKWPGVKRVYYKTTIETTGPNKFFTMKKSLQRRLYETLESVL